ncbi:hypothetical protein BCV70DRAFT_2732 [Testicularia cyperi]|uniref:Uncharacterized protein n=1 Tax=Testicularia cyperi TaxID=1882483 RepID=A0A317XXP9_9BASI|nr:hypothetical protein BCV70DRAFT_2732 [Testicularia cyperi]
MKLFRKEMKFERGEQPSFGYHSGAKRNRHAEGAFLPMQGACNAKNVSDNAPSTFREEAIQLCQLKKCAMHKDEESKPQTSKRIKELERLLQNYKAPQLLFLFRRQLLAKMRLDTTVLVLVAFRVCSAAPLPMSPMIEREAAGFGRYPSLVEYAFNGSDELEKIAANGLVRAHEDNLQRSRQELLYATHTEEEFPRGAYDFAVISGNIHKQPTEETQYSRVEFPEDVQRILGTPAPKTPYGRDKLEQIEIPFGSKRRHSQVIGKIKRLPSKIFDRQYSSSSDSSTGSPFSPDLRRGVQRIGEQLRELSSDETATPKSEMKRTNSKLARWFGGRGRP